MFRRGEEERHDPIEPEEVRMADTAGSEVTVVGQGARIEGTLVSAGSLRIDGQVKGKIAAEGDVMLSPQSRVEADINATNVTIGGAFRGNIVAKAKAELTRGGKVEGNVTSKSLVIAEGAVFSGQSVMGEQQAQAAATSAPQPSDGHAERPAAQQAERARA
jgi:cytoskeletal protein CcmA (bactofilin family)